MLAVNLELDPDTWERKYLATVTPRIMCVPTYIPVSNRDLLCMQVTSHAAEGGYQSVV
jgi:hypothetical protein